MRIVETQTGRVPPPHAQHGTIHDAPEAQAAYRKALSMRQQEPERRYLERRLQELEKQYFGCVSNLGAAKRLRVQDQNKTKEKTYAIHDADDPQCLQRQ